MKHKPTMKRQNHNGMNPLIKIMIGVCVLLGTLSVNAQERIIHPDISYEGNPRLLTIGGINLDPVEGYEDAIVLGVSGLTVGQEIALPGSAITDAIKRYWRHGLFSDVAISADSIINNKVWLHIHLKVRPRVSTINYVGVKKSEKEDLEAKLGLLRGSQITPNMIDRAKILAKRYYDDKGFKNAQIDIFQREDITQKNHVILDVTIDKKQKMKVRNIIIEGNDKLDDKRIKGQLLTKGVFKKTHEAGKLSTFLKSKKFTDERWKEDKQKLIEKYNELGYRDAVIVKDSVWNVDDKHVNVYVKVDEGQKYYIRNITWVGNTVYSTDYLSQVLGMKKGDVYNQKLLNKRLTEDEDAVGNNYWNNGYLFHNLEPAEVNIEGDSVDLEMRIFEGTQARINHVRIYGNTRVYENVIRRELRVKPGDLFSKEALMRSARDLASMGHFDQENVSPDVKPNPSDGTVDINWTLVPKPSDQLQLSLGWGQTGLIGSAAIKLNNFSLRNLISRKGKRRGILPIGDGEQLSIGLQTNADYYTSVNLGYSTNWFGGKRPIQFSVNTFYSKQSDVSSNFYNTAAVNSYYNSLYGYGSNYYGGYENYYDPDTYIKIMGASLGWGKRLRWPDDYFMLSLELSYTRYQLKNWKYNFLMSNGNANNLNVGLNLNRVSTDNQLFPRRGSEFSFSVSITPPWSMWDGKDYEHLATNRRSVNYGLELQEKFRWLEFHKWKFKMRTYTALSGGQRCFVLMTRVEAGLLGSYNRFKKSPFETFYVGGDGMSGSYTGYSIETIALRGYDNGALTQDENVGYAYSRLALELRYPFMLGTTTIYGLGFLEGGNAWTDTSKFNIFSMKRSAGVGVRIFLPMIGLMGLDWAYGFDKINGKRSGSHIHFVFGQEF